MTCPGYNSVCIIAVFDSANPKILFCVNCATHPIKWEIKPQANSLRITLFTSIIKCYNFVPNLWFAVYLHLPVLHITHFSGDEHSRNTLIFTLLSSNTPFSFALHCAYLNCIYLSGTDPGGGLVGLRGL